MRIAISAALCLCAGGALAANSWQTVTLAGNPAVTLDIPASSGKDYQPDDASKAQGMMMSFTLETKDSGAIGCGLNSISYQAFTKRDDVTQGMFISPDSFCSEFPDSTGTKSLFSRGAVSNGSPGAVCANSFSKGAAGSNGYVFSSFSVAAPDRLYHLNCIVNAATQDSAEKLWNTTWSQFVGHIQDSIHLPVKGEFSK